MDDLEFDWITAMRCRDLMNVRVHQNRPKMNPHIHLVARW